VTRVRRRRTRRAGLPVGRLSLIAVGGLVAFGALLARAVQLQALDAPRLRQLAAAQTRTTVELQVPRGQLLDRRGHPLAISAPVTSVAALPRAIPDRHHTAVVLAHVLKGPVGEIYARLDPRRSFRWVRRWVPPQTARQLEELALPGIELHPEHRRFYPHGRLAAAYLGFAGRDGRGLSGLELLYDGALSGRGALLPALRDAHGRRLLLGDADAAVESSRDVRLALDLNLSHFAAQALERAVGEHRARGGTLVALDPHTGEVLAFAQVPSFDPNRFWLEPRERFRARAFVDTFEPGSTLKPFTVALALDAGVVSPDTLFDCENGLWRVGGRVIHDFRPHGVLDVRGVLRVSSNIGAAKIAGRLGTRALVEGMRSFGFGVPTNSRFPGESPGRVRRLAEKQAVERANLSFGHGLTVTAVQLAAAGATLANGGRRVTPRLLAAAPTPPPPGERVVSEATARAMLEMMRGAVEEGTGRAAALPHHPVAGKTGTAQKVVDGRYSHDRYVASFLGIVPALNPRLVLVVVLDEPQGVHTGGLVAAPVFREVAQFAVEQLAIPEGAG
jgi:cell division protein FtsI (penicillin-binding protein 3)